MHIKAFLLGADCNEILINVSIQNDWCAISSKVLYHVKYQVKLVTISDLKPHTERAFLISRPLGF